MKSETDTGTKEQEARLWRPDFIYSILLLAAATATLVVTGNGGGLLAGESDLGIAGFFVVFGLFTIATGFPHPVFGHVSFDRVAQVMSILVLGPIDAAWVNGLASFIYPWQRLRQGVPPRLVLTAAMHNSGLMMFMILGCGVLYSYLGGSIPLVALDVRAGILLCGLIVAMQIVNDVGMMVILHLKRMDPRQVFNRFTATVEFVAGAAGVILAAVFTHLSTPYFVLLLAVLAAGMLVIMQYAIMRNRLEKLVEERTEELQVQAEKFERQATHDKLTGLPNRRHADDFLQQQIDLAERADQKGSVVLADIDHFKRINDNHSHATGDKVLQRIAELLSDGCRKTDFVARYGGEEFLLFLPNTELGRAHEVCNELRRAIEIADWSDIAPELYVTASFGVTEIESSLRTTAILNEADLRLYRAKREGRNRVIAA